MSYVISLPKMTRPNSGVRLFVCLLANWMVSWLSGLGCMYL